MLAPEAVSMENAQCSQPCNNEEQQYLDLIKRILNTGNVRYDRTGTGTIGLFGQQMRFSLRESILPLLTTKKVYFKGVLEELLFFIKGDTNAKHLQEKNVRIWDGHSTKEYLATRGLSDRDEGDLGPVYGFQWRHWGAQYKTMHDDYTGQGIDQLQKAIDTIKNNPYDRRILVTAFNVSDLPLMALPPCHMLFQFYVANGRLSCQMYQRSCDVGLGVPFNIASYALLTIMVAHVCNLEPDELIIAMGDTHVYSDHVEALNEQLSRVPRSFPKLLIKDGIKRDKINDFQYDDFILADYNPYGVIKMKMSV